MVTLNSRSTNSEQAQSLFYSMPKRAIDVVGACVGLLVALPLMACISIAIKLDSRGPAIFAHWRVGRNGKPFRMYKFRTMVDGADGLRAALLASMSLQEPVLKIYADPRITTVGRFLRRWSLDELPQFVNVLHGEMSLVGPRPEELCIVNTYSPWHSLRLRVTPGMTGPMQVSGRAVLLLDERVRLELEYINHPSLRQDLKILTRTVQAVLSGDGSC